LGISAETNSILLLRWYGTLYIRSLIIACTYLLASSTKGIFPPS